MNNHVLNGGCCGNVKVHETRPQAHANAEEEKAGEKKQKAENKTHEAEQAQKKAKPEKEDKDNGQRNGKSAAEIAKEFEQFCKATSQHLSIKQMREILEANEQEPSGSADAVVPRWLVIFLSLPCKSFIPRSTC